MANTLTKRVLAQTGKRYAFFLTLVSDGTEETTTVLADLSTFQGPPTKCSIRKLAYAGSVNAAATIALLWDHTTDDLAWQFEGPSNLTEFCFECGNGLIDPGSAGGTGDLVVATTGLDATDTINLYVELELF